MPYKLLPILLLVGCTIDYRTDYEIANGIVVPEEVIEARKDRDRERREWQVRQYEEQLFREALRRCGDRLIAECL